MILAVVRLLLRWERRRLERATFGPFDLRRSVKLDRVILALEVLE